MLVCLFIVVSLLVLCLLVFLGRQQVLVVRVGDLGGDWLLFYCWCLRCFTRLCGICCSTCLVPVYLAVAAYCFGWFIRCGRLILAVVAYCLCFVLYILFIAFAWIPVEWFVCVIALVLGLVVCCGFDCCLRVCCGLGDCYGGCLWLICCFC